MVNETHERLRPLIAACANRFYKIYGGSQEDIFQAAWLIFLEAEKSHNPARGSLEKRAAYMIFQRLRDQRRGEYRLRIREREYAPPENSDFSVAGFVDSVSAETAEIIRVFLDVAEIPCARKKFWEICERRGITGGARLAVFDEIREALFA